MKKIVLGTDHAGYELKEVLKDHLLNLGYEVKDMGCDSTDSCDYPDFIIPAAEAVVADDALGFVFGGSGQGEAFAANKVKGIRAAVLNCENMSLVELSRTHNDANILSFGARFVGVDFAKKAVEKWLNTDFERGRHLGRLAKVSAYEDVQ